MKSLLILCLACVGLASAGVSAPSADYKDDPIITLESNIQDSGKYHYHYETGGGSKATQDGFLKNIDKDHDGEVIEGTFSYISKDDGVEYSISYTADENGYQPHGSHIPTPPPIPLAIQRALEWIAAHPYVEKEEKLPVKG